jgi:hypothetical protein
LKGKGKRLVNKNGCIHVFDIEKDKYVKSRGKNLAEAVDHVELGDREALVNRERKDILKNYKILTNGK